MKLLKVLVLAVLGFTVPVTLAVELGPRLFRTTLQSDQPDSRASFSRAGDPNAPSGAPGTKDSSLAVSDSPEADHVVATDQSGSEPSSAFRVVSSDPALDPNAEGYFVVSTLLKLSNAPQHGKRQKVIAKYSSKQAPFPGWAIALRQTDTSLRPEVYWQSSDGKGGWYTFDHIHLDRSRWYSFTLVAKDNELLSLYLEDLGSSPNGSQAEQSSAVEEENREDGVTGVRFLGGYNLTGVSVGPTDAELQFAPKFLEAGDLKGELGPLLIARLDKISRNPVKLRELLSGGSELLKNRLEEKDVALWIDMDGRDQSKYHREITQNAKT
ncbi:MAG: hypothetical protein U0136_04395 [Bdellovibrionota bacterium]